MSLTQYERNLIASLKDERARLRALQQKIRKELRELSDEKIAGKFETSQIEVKKI